MRRKVISASVGFWTLGFCDIPFDFVWFGNWGVTKNNSKGL
jgi:hypothetical protein